MTSFIISFVTVLFNILSIVILIRILFSWFQPDPSNWLVQFIISVSEPILAPFRLPIFRIGMLDLSPIVAIFALSIIERIIISALTYFL
jgi:YggT family protein